MSLPHGNRKHRRPDCERVLVNGSTVRMLTEEEIEEVYAYVRRAMAAKAGGPVLHAVADHPIVDAYSRLWKE